MSTDHRSSASAQIEKLIALLRAAPDQKQFEAVIAESEALARSIAAFHIEGIRFRMFNVDRMLTKGSLPVPADVPAVFADLRRDLEAAGFHTRSHQAPPATKS
jgi:hypothetical protein